MNCKCARHTDEFHGWACSVSDGPCMFMVPDSKQCAEKYNEGPDANQDKCEDCGNFYREDGKRCCKLCPYSERELFSNGQLFKSKYIDNDVVSCGGFNKIEEKLK